MPHCPLPSSGLLAVGKRNAGPMPQMNFPGLPGERKAVNVVSPMPATWLSPSRGPAIHRKDRACDDVPVLVQRDRNHRLDVQRALVGGIRPGPEAHVPLHGHADEIADGVLRDLGEGFRVVGGCGGRINRLREVAFRERARVAQGDPKTENGAINQGKFHWAVCWINSGIGLPTTRGCRQWIPVFSDFGHGDSLTHTRTRRIVRIAWAATAGHKRLPIHLLPRPR